MAPFYDPSGEVTWQQRSLFKAYDQLFKYPPNDPALKLVSEIKEKYGIKDDLATGERLLPIELEKDGRLRSKITDVEFLPIKSINYLFPLIIKVTILL